ncbi:uncharacterized protein LOC106152053 [Lingula anatina]|uniref:Uncharacterized protein LOC106152053 n=1 Tax=Lingula anatina TaxID=7574 RepID=A0A1S3H4P5_LINAN|nr:uncharacterized protein LOC106152053 [Lingula anatina]XP_013380979.1 uncharacterized protein LOC106152053 [Lingula anatina]|eukprot:XP_013380978.1 uncharacterized protein LOC106152053 [Lingula anatina]
MSGASRQHHHQRSVTSQRDQGDPRASTSQRNNQNNEQQHIQLQSQTQSRHSFTDQEEGGHHARAESIEARSHYGSSIYLRRDSTDSPLLFEMRGVLSSPPKSDITNARLVEEEARSHAPRAEMEEKVCKCTQPGSSCFLPTMHYNGVKCEHRTCAAREQHTIVLPPAFKGTNMEGLFARQNTTDGTSTNFFDSSAVDPSSGKTYYYNSRTGDRTWTIQHNT